MSTHSPKLLYVTAEDWHFWSHRLPMARAARDAGFEVHVAGRFTDHRQLIQQEGFVIHPLRWTRGNTRPWSVAHDVAELIRVWRELQPDLVHAVALKPILLTGFAAPFCPATPTVNTLTGLGFAFSSPSFRARVLRGLIERVLKPTLNRRGSIVVVQNRDDRALLVSRGLVPSGAVRLVRGSGIDIEHYQQLPEPEGPITVGYAGRMLEDKGVPTLLAAHEKLLREGHEIRLLLAGTPDPNNPTSLSETELRERCRSRLVEWLGHVDDVRTLWARCHIATLPSRREGLPKSLLEAAACGRAIVATDVPGCREVAVDCKNAILVPVDNAEALATGLRRLAEDSQLRRRMAGEGVLIVRSDLSAAAVAQAMSSIYEGLVGRSTG